MRHKRSRNLDDFLIKQIVGIIDGWSGKLTWDLLISAIEKRFFCRYTRQTLFNHPRIKNAFDLRKSSLSEDKSTRPHISIELQKALERIARLEVENKRLESENHDLLEQFARWSYNSYTKGLSSEFLNKPLPRVSRN